MEDFAQSLVAGPDELATRELRPTPFLAFLTGSDRLFRLSRTDARIAGRAPNLPAERILPASRLKQRAHRGAWTLPLEGPC